VYWYTSLMALTPQPPNADAFAGMALGATIGKLGSQRCGSGGALQDLLFNNPTHSKAMHASNAIATH
jgi:hypothetical protein